MTLVILNRYNLSMWVLHLPQRYTKQIRCPIKTSELKKIEITTYHDLLDLWKLHFLDQWAAILAPNPSFPNVTTHTVHCTSKLYCGIMCGNKEWEWKGWRRRERAEVSRLRCCCNKVSNDRVQDSGHACLLHHLSWLACHTGTITEVVGQATCLNEVQMRVMGEAAER